MILLVDTSTPTCRLTIVDGGNATTTEWEAGRTLAAGLLKFIHDQLESIGATTADLTGLGVFRGPGSFTGLRIGITVMNTLAYIREVPIVGTMGEQWQSEALDRLRAGQSDQLVLPEYGALPTITTPRK